ncbi:chaperonin 10-like protein, partial [Amanita rubescens]
MTTPKEHTAIVATDGKGRIDTIQVPTPEPGPGEVLIKVDYAAFIAFDTYITDIGYYVSDFPHTLGFDAAGTIIKVGEDVKNLHIGDRVTAFTYGASARKGAQQFIVAPYTVCAKVPDSLSLKEAVTIPDNFITAFYTVFNQLEIPRPSSFLKAPTPPNASIPILVYGAGTIAGQYAVQLLHLAGYKNIIATASVRNHELLKSFGATHVFDYRSPTLEEDVARVVGSDGKVPIVIDGVTSEGTLKIIAKLVSPKGKVALLLPVE